MQMAEDWKNYWDLTGSDATGAFSRSPFSTFAPGVGKGDGSLFSFNASSSNAIYGNSNTVQPPAIVMNYIIKC